MKRIIVVRHGESTWNLPCADHEKKFTGQFECPLTEKGREQARRVGELLRDMRCKIDHIFCSTIGRARETASLIAKSYGRHVPLEFTDGLRERSLGVFEGRHVREVFREYPHYRNDPSLNRFCNDFRQKAPGGENLSEVMERAWKVWERAEEMPGEDALIVSHAVTIRCLAGRALEFPDDQTKEIHLPNAKPIIISALRPRRLVYPSFIPSLSSSHSSVL